MDILIAVVIVSVIGIIIGIGLSLASVFFSVPKDETESKIRECLPGANCGACGYSGCDGYASAIAKGETENISLCTPGGNSVAKEIALITGKVAEDIAPVTAVVRCNGSCENSSEKLNYEGIKTCKAASMMFGGQKTCIHGCLGYGDCLKACSENAISICDSVARIDSSKCVACAKCMNTCPKGLIDLLPKAKLQAVVMCRNSEKGAVAQKACKVSCIGCSKCAKTCENGAITVENFLARVDATKCNGCGKCKEVCIKNCIEIVKI